MNLDKLKERREKRVHATHAKAGQAHATQASIERTDILRELKALPLKKLRAIHKAAQKAFATKP